MGRQKIIFCAGILLSGSVSRLEIEKVLFFQRLKNVAFFFLLLIIQCILLPTGDCAEIEKINLDVRFF